MGDQQRGGARRHAGSRRCPRAPGRAGPRPARRTVRRAAAPAAGRPTRVPAPPAVAARRRSRGDGRLRARRVRPPTASARPGARASRRVARSMPNAMFSATLRCGNRAPSCGIRPTRRRWTGTVRGPARDQLAGDAHRPRVGGLEAGQDAQQRRLAAAGRSQHRGDGALRQVEVHAGQHLTVRRRTSRCPAPRRLRNRVSHCELRLPLVLHIPSTAVGTAANTSSAAAYGAAAA